MLRSGLNFLLTQERLYIKHICISMKYASSNFANPFLLSLASEYVKDKIVRCFEPDMFKQQWTASL